MTTRLRTANLEAADSNFEEGVGELAVEEKYAEVNQLIVLGKEKGFLLYDEIYEVLPEEITSLPEELDEIYIRFADLGIDVVEDAEKPLPTPSAKTIVTIDGAIELGHTLAVPAFLGFGDLSLNFQFSALEIVALHRPKVLVDSLESLVVDIVTESELREQRDLGFAPKMGLDLAEINRFAGLKVVFYDRKDRFAPRVLEVLLSDALHLRLV